MPRELKNTRIKWLPPRVQLQERDSVSGSIPTVARTVFDNRTGMYKKFFDDTKTVYFKEYVKAEGAFVSASYTGPGFDVNASYANYNLGSSAILWWRFESLGTDASGSLTSPDSVNGRHTAEFFSNTYATSSDVPPYYNNIRDTFSNAASIHITGNVAGDTTIADNTSAFKSETDFTLSTKFTVACHFNLDVLGNPTPIISRGTSVGHVSDWEVLVTNTGKVQFVAFDTGTGQYIVYETDESYINTDKWYHVAVTFNAGTGSALIYVNGTLAPNSVVANTGWTSFSSGNRSIFLGAAFDTDYIGSSVVAYGKFDGVVLANALASLAEISFLRLGAPIPGDVDTPAYFTANAGVQMPTGLNVGHSALLRENQSGSMVENTELTTDFYITSQIQKGIGDYYIRSTPGQDIQPFRDSNLIAVDGKQTLSGSAQNPFYATGSAIDEIGTGFEQPLWSKTFFEIDLTPSSAHAVSLWQSGSSVTGVNYPVCYWNNATRKYEGIGSGIVMAAYASGTLTTLRRCLEEQPIAIGESMFSCVTTSNSQSYESAGLPISDFGFPYHPKFHATSSNYIPLSGVLASPFLLEKVVLEFSGAFAFGSNYSANSQSYDAAISTFFIMNQRYPFSIELTNQQTITWSSGSVSTFVTGVIVPGSDASRNSTRDLVTTLRLASFVSFSSGGPSIGVLSASNAIRADLSMFVPNQTLSSLGGPPVWSGRFVVSGSVRNTFCSDPGRSLLLKGSGTPTYLFTHQQNSTRAGLQKSSARSHISDLASGQTIKSVTQDSLVTFDVKNRYTQTNPYMLMPTDNLIVGWSIPMSKILNDSLTGTTEFTGQGPSLSFAPALSKITFFGSNVSEGEEYHDTLNQLLTSVACTEVIGGNL